MFVNVSLNRPGDLYFEIIFVFSKVGSNDSSSDSEALLSCEIFDFLAGGVFHLLRLTLPASVRACLLPLFRLTRAPIRRLFQGPLPGCGRRGVSSLPTG